MKNLTFKDVLAWLTALTPFVLSAFGFDLGLLLPHLDTILSSGGILYAMYLRVAGVIGEQGIKPFLHSGTVQAGIIALFVTYAQYFGIDGTQAIVLGKAIFAAAVALYGLFRKGAATKSIQGIL